MKRDEVKELIEKGVQELSQALAGGKSEQLQRFLDVMATFPHYSFGNCILIAMQKPEASMVQGFQAWKKLGRWVRKGEKGIGIIAPMVYRNKEAETEEDDRTIRGFKVVHVYDVSQTEGKELPELSQMHGEPGEYVATLEHFIRNQGIHLVYEPISSGAQGVSLKGTIVIQPELEPSDRFATLVHELAHELLHFDSQRRKETTKCIRETEAEAVAHIVCRAVGMDSTSRSADYIQLYRGDTEVLTASLEAIQKAAAQILEALKVTSSRKEVA